MKRLKTRQDLDAKHEWYYRDILYRMKYAYTNEFPKYRDIYIKMGFPLDKVTEYARKHAVWESFMYRYYSQPGLMSPLKEIVKAYNEMYPGSYGQNRMCVLIKKAKEEGIPSVLMKKKPTGRPKDFNEVYEYWVMQLASSGKAYSKADIHREVCAMCEEQGYKSPCLTTVKRLFAKWAPLVQENRYGKDKTRFGNMGYVSIIPAENANDQWQIDGWRIPLYYKDSKDSKGYKTLCLFWVLDAHSKRIVGYKIAESENTETILDGLENAVRNTGALPFEIVSDNHSFNQTKVAENFKAELDGLGCTWTVTENPRYKSLVERSFKILGEQYMKKHYGYIGEGVKTKNPDGRTSQELFDKYTKGNGWLDINQVKAIAVYCVGEYNKRLDKGSKSPIIRYKESKKPNEIKLENPETNARFYKLFTRDLSELLVRRMQIKFTRSGMDYEYQLSAKLGQEWNDKKVRVRYVNPSDGIYLYHPDTDEALGYVPMKQKAHGALANQTKDDTIIMSKTKSINKSVQNKNKDKLVDLYTEAQNIDPKAVELVNQRLTPKNALDELRKDAVLANEFIRNGGDLQRTADIPVFSEAIVIETKSKEDKRKDESPFHTEKEFDLSKIELDY